AYLCRPFRAGDGWASGTQGVALRYCISAFQAGYLMVGAADIMPFSVSEIFNQGLAVHEGFPYPDWKSIHEWARDHLVESETGEFWDSLTSLWQDKIRERLGEGTECDESDRAFLISKEAQEWCEKFLDFAERSISLI